MGLKTQLNMYVFVPLFLTVAIVLIENSIFILDSNDEAITLMKSHFREIGVDYILQKNSLQQMILEFQLQEKRMDLSVIRTLLEKRIRGTLNHASWQAVDILGDKGIPLVTRQSVMETYANSPDTLAAYFLWHEPNSVAEYANWSTGMQTYFNEFMYMLDILPRAYPDRQMYSVDPNSDISIIYPIETQIPNYTDVNATYDPKSYRYYQDTVSQATNKKGQYYYNRPFWNKTQIVVPFCGVSQSTSLSVEGVTCMNVGMGTVLKKLMIGQLKNLLNLYSYMIHPVTREITAMTNYNLSGVVTIDQFEFGMNYTQSPLYWDFKHKTEFIEQDPLVLSNLDDCFDRENLPETLQFIDDSGETYILVIRDIDFCLKNQNNKFNLIRVAYIGTAINVNSLNQYILSNLTTMTIIRELSLLVNTVSICGVCLAVAFVSFYFSDEIFAPIENLTKGMKRVDSVSIKVIHKQLETLSQKNYANQETFEPLFAYYNLQSLVTNAIDFYTQGLINDSLRAFEHGQAIFNKVGNLEGEFVCKHNQGVIHILQNNLKQGIELLESGLDWALSERLSFIQRQHTKHAINEVLQRKLELINGILEIQAVLKSFGKVSSVYVYAQVLLAQTLLQMDDRIEDAVVAANTAAELLEFHIQKLNPDSLQYFSIPVLEAAMLVLSAGIEESKGEAHLAAQLYTQSIEEGNEYYTKFRLDALNGIIRILHQNHIEDSGEVVSEILRNYQRRPKDLYFLLDSNLSSDYLEHAVDLRERIIRVLSSTHEMQASQFTCSPTDIRVDFFRTSCDEARSSNYRIQSGGLVVLPKDSQKYSSSLSMGLNNIASRISETAAIAEQRMSTYKDRLSKQNVLIDSTQKQPPRVQKVLFVLCDLSENSLDYTCIESSQRELSDYTVIIVDIHAHDQHSKRADTHIQYGVLNRAIIAESHSHIHCVNYHYAASAHAQSKALSQIINYLEETHLEFAVNFEYLQ